jgi:hypothetical protein
VMIVRPGTSQLELSGPRTDDPEGSIMGAVVQIGSHRFTRLEGRRIRILVVEPSSGAIRSLTDPRFDLHDPEWSRGPGLTDL